MPSRQGGADASDNPASGVSPDRDRRSRVPCGATADSSGHSAGAHRRCPGTCPRPTKDRAGPGVRSASRVAPDHLLVVRGDELARIPLQSAPHFASGHRLRHVHDDRSRSGNPLAVGFRLACGLYLRRHRFAARSRGAARHRPPNAASEAPRRHPRRRRPGERRYRAHPLSLRDRGRERRHILLRPSSRHVCRHSRRRVSLGDRRWLGDAAAAALGRRHAHRDHALDPDTIPRLLAAPNIWAGPACSPR